MDSLESELVGFSAELVNLRSKLKQAGPAGQPASAAKQQLQTSITLCLGAGCNSQGPGSGEANGGGRSFYVLNEHVYDPRCLVEQTFQSCTRIRCEKGAQRACIRSSSLRAVLTTTVD